MRTREEAQKLIGLTTRKVLVATLGTRSITMEYSALSKPKGRDILNMVHRRVVMEHLWYDQGRKKLEGCFAECAYPVKFTILEYETECGFANQAYWDSEEYSKIFSETPITLEEILQLFTKV